MPSTRSRHRNKSRGKSRHRSTHSTARPPSVAPSGRHSRTISNPPPNHRCGVHDKTPQELKEDHDYVKKVLAYLEQPGPSSVGGSASKTTINKSSGFDTKNINSNLNKNKEHNSSTGHIKKALDPSCKSPKKTPTKINNKVSDPSKKSPKHCPKSPKLARKPTDPIDPSTGAVPKLNNPLSSSSSPKKIKKQSSPQGPIRSDKLDEVCTKPSSCDSSKDCQADIRIPETSSENCTSSSKLITMADSKSPAAVDCISLLCSKLAEMGATKPTTGDIAAAKGLMREATTTASKTQSSNSVLSNQNKPIKSQTEKVNATSSFMEASRTSSLLPTQNGNVDEEPSLNTSGQLSPEELAAERKARKEAKKAKKVDRSAVGSEASKPNEKSQNKNNSEANKENVLAKQSSESSKNQAEQQEKSKADLKRERRAVQEAQRAAKEQAQKVPAAKKTSAAVPVEAAAKKGPQSSLRPDLKKDGSSAASKGPTSEGFSSLPFVTHLEDPNYLVGQPENFSKVTPEFETLTHQIYVGDMVDTNEQCMSFLNALYVFLEDFYAPPDTNVYRLISAKLKINISYMTHYSAFTQPMANLVRVFLRVLQSSSRELKMTFSKYAPSATKPVVIEPPSYDDDDDDSDDENPRKVSPFKEFPELLACSPEERARQLAWGEALHKSMVEMREWLLNFSRKVFQQNTKVMIGRITKFINDDDHILIFGYSRLILRAIQEACEQDGRSLTLSVLESDRTGREQNMAAELDKLDLKRGRVNMVPFSNLNLVVPKVQKVLVCCNYVRGDGSSQGPVGHSLVALTAKKARVPVLGVCYTFQFTEEDSKEHLVKNRLGSPCDYFWGRQDFTRKVRVSSQFMKGYTLDHLSSRSREPLQSNPRRFRLQKSESEHFLGHSSHISQPAPVSSNEAITSFLDPRPPHPLTKMTASLSSTSYSVADRSIPLSRPWAVSTVPMFCIKYDYAAPTLAYFITDLHTIPPPQAQFVAARLHKLLSAF